MTGSDDSGPDMVLKVPEGCNIGMTNALHDYIRENGRIECFGTITISRGNDVEPSVPSSELEQLADGLRADIETTREANKKWTGDAKYIYYRDGRATALEGVVADLNDIIADYRGEADG